MSRRTRQGLVVLGGLLGACGTHRAAPLGDYSGGFPRGPDAGREGGLYIPPPEPPPADAGDAGGVCGNLIVPLVVDRPNFYFVLDGSGSMREPMDTANDSGFLPSRYLAAVSAIDDLLRAVGHRVSYGVTVFPNAAPDGSGGCSPGEQVFPDPSEGPVTPGDPLGSSTSGSLGPILQRLDTTLVRRTPKGGTPTSATLSAVHDTLTGLPGDTYLFLLTDGAPNCNPANPCSADQCTANIEGGCGLPAGYNCCDPANGFYDYGTCLDAAPTLAAVQYLRASGVQTFVIGMPGTSVYGTLLDDLAEAGGTARSGSPRYYPVSSADELTKTLQQIGLSVAISCSVKLGAPPPDRELVNVYFDRVVVPLDPTNGWTWATDDEIQIVGTSCDQLKSGGALQLQVVSGCPSTVR